MGRHELTSSLHFNRLPLNSCHKPPRLRRRRDRLGSILLRTFAQSALFRSPPAGLRRQGGTPATTRESQGRSCSSEEEGKGIETNGNRNPDFGGCDDGEEWQTRQEGGEDGGGKEDVGKGGSSSGSETVRRRDQPGCCNTMDNHDHYKSRDGTIDRASW